MVYIKLFIDYLDAIEPLGDAERGRLFTALMQYAKTGEAPQLNGNERFIFPMMKAQIDRDREAQGDLSAKRAVAGASGGKQKQANLASASKPSKPSKCEQDKEKDKEKDKEEDSPPKPPRGTRTRFQPPTLEDVEEFCRERGSSVDPKKFYEYFQAGDWTDSKGNKVKSWKQKIITWEKYQTDKASSGRTVPKYDVDPDDEEVLHV